jgi:hypothetical protein
VVIGLLVFQEPFGFMPFLGVISVGHCDQQCHCTIDRIEVEEKVLKRLLNTYHNFGLPATFRPYYIITLHTPPF